MKKPPKLRKNIMLAYEYTEKRLLKYPKPWILQPKLEGDRCRAVYDTETGWHLFSSSNSPRKMVPHIAEELNKNILYRDFGDLDGELDGEFYVHGMRHEDIRSIVSPTVNKHPDSERMEYHIFDFVSELPQFERYMMLKTLNETEIIKRVDTVLCNTIEEIQAYYEGCLDLGYEGIIIRDPSKPYIRSAPAHSTFLMKLKPRNELNAIVIGIYEEIDIHGMRKNCLGGCVCMAKNEKGEPFEFNVGSGFLKQQREDYWKDKDKIIGKMIEVTYQSFTDTTIKMQSFKRIVGDYSYD